jgi:hypothetical protein
MKKLSAGLLVFVLLACGQGTHDGATGVDESAAASTERKASGTPGGKVVALYDTHKSMTVALNKNTVICSTADYSAEMLKVVIPELGDVTLLNHRNAGAGGPCMAAGACAPGNEPSDIVDSSNPTERIDVHITVSRSTSVDQTNNTCLVSLVETLETTIRGVKFAHKRAADLGQRALEDCI